MKRNAVVIGLPAGRDPGKDRQYLSRHDADAIHAPGGIPVIIPLLEYARALSPWAERLDGMLLTGSGCDLTSWILAVQWHPGKTFSCDAFSRNIFDLFVARCRAESSCA